MDRRVQHCQQTVAYQRCRSPACGVASSLNQHKPTYQACCSTVSVLPLLPLQDWKVSRDCRGVQCVDGSFPDFFAGVNCDLLQCGGDAVVFDYFDVS